MGRDEKKGRKEQQRHAAAEVIAVSSDEDSKPDVGSNEDVAMVDIDRRQNKRIRADVKSGARADDEEDPAMSASDVQSDDDEGFVPFVDDTELTLQPSTSAEVPWYRQESVDRDGFQFLHNEILDFCDLIMPTDQERANMADAISYVEDLARGLFGKRVEVVVFGSQFTGLVLPTSDLDMCINGVPLNERQAVIELGKVLRKRQNKQEVEKVEVVQAKVAIVKFVHAASGMNCDICCNNDTSTKTGELAKAFMRDLVPARPLAMVIKHFLWQRNMNETYYGWVGSYMVQCMVVGLMQHISHQQRVRNLPFEYNLGSLLLEFFWLYGVSMNPYTTALSLLDGGRFLPKGELGWLDRSRGNTFAIENPQDPSADIGRNSYQAQVIKKALAGTYHRMCSALQAHRTERNSSSSILKMAIRPDDLLRTRLITAYPKFRSKKFATPDSTRFPTYALPLSNRTPGRGRGGADERSGHRHGRDSSSSSDESRHNLGSKRKSSGHSQTPSNRSKPSPKRHRQGGSSSKVEEARDEVPQHGPP